MPDLWALCRAVREALAQQEAITARLREVLGVIEAEVQQTGASASVVPYDEIVKEWNERCASVGMRRRNVAGELKQKMRACWLKHPSIEIWRGALSACAADDWWNGNRGQWRGALENFLVPKHFDRFVDEALASTAPAPGPLALDSERGLPADAVEREFMALLNDKTRPLPTGFTGPDPREVRGRDDEEFARRRDLLKDWMAGDWRFGA